MRNRIFIKPIVLGLTISILLSLIVFTSSPIYAGSYDGEDLALAILQNGSLLVSQIY